MASNWNKTKTDWAHKVIGSVEMRPFDLDPFVLECACVDVSQLVVPAINLLQTNSWGIYSCEWLFRDELSIVSMTMEPRWFEIGKKKRRVFLYICVQNSRLSICRPRSISYRQMDMRKCNFPLYWQTSSYLATRWGAIHHNSLEMHLWYKKQKTNLNPHRFEDSRVPSSSI